MPDVYNLEIEQGSTYSLQIIAKDADGVAIDLTTYSARGDIRFRHSDATPLLVLAPTIDNSFVSGIINLTIPATGTATLPITKALYDIEIYTTGGYVNKVLGGSVSIYPEVTY